MLDQFKQELIDYGVAQMPKYKPKDLDLYKAQQITKLLDKYSNKWVALHNAINVKKQEILARQADESFDSLSMETEFERAVVTIRNKFTAAYPLNL